MDFKTAMQREIEQTVTRAQQGAQLRAAAQGLSVDEQRAAGLHARADVQARVDAKLNDPEAFRETFVRIRHMDDCVSTPPPPVMVISPKPSTCISFEVTVATLGEVGAAVDFELRRLISEVDFTVRR